jgi:hypothetical protein
MDSPIYLFQKNYIKCVGPNLENMGKQVPLLKDEIGTPSLTPSFDSQNAYKPHQIPDEILIPTTHS